MHKIRPIPNINGSPAQDLAEQMMEAANALRNAARLMAMAQPHGRDYQTVNCGGDFDRDRQEYMRRAKLIDELAQQYQDEALTVLDADWRPSRGRAQREVNT